MSDEICETRSASPRVSVVIPTLNAAVWLPALLENLEAQSVPIAELILMDSMSTDRTAAIATERAYARVVPVTDFSHGGTRNRGVAEASGDIVVLMTQDAAPADSQWLSALIAPLSDSNVGATFSRQTPREDATPMERFFLATRFPETSKRMQKLPGHEPSFQNEIFLSNVSSAARREVFLKHPFDQDLIMSEDQQFARDLVRADLAVVYAPESVVLHSHVYTLGGIVRRYFDSAYSLKQIFSEHDVGDSASLGIKYLKLESVHMLRHHPLWLPYYVLYTSAKVLGTVCAHFAEYMPGWMLSRLSLHAYHWRERQR